MPQSVCGVRDALGGHIFRPQYPPSKSLVRNFPCDISLVSWNIQTWFGTTRAKRSRIKMKHGIVLQFAAAFDIVCLQETHGTSVDLGAILRELPHHLAFGTFFADPYRGGAVTLVGPRVARRYSNWRQDTLEEGRVLSVMADAENGNFEVCNLHLDSSWRSEKYSSVFRKIASIILPFYCALFFIGGDWNFLAGEEARLHLVEGNELRDRDGHAQAFENTLGQLTELHRDGYTHRVTLDGRLDALARLDRWYCNIPASYLLDADVATGTRWPIEDIKKPSDHAPPFCTIRPRAVPDGNVQLVKRIPRWVAQHDCFEQYCKRIVDEGHIRDHPLQAIRDIKDVFRAAAEQIIDICCERGARTTQEKIYWALEAQRHDRAGREHGVRKALRADPQLCNFCDADSGNCSSPLGLSRHISELTRANIEDIRDEINALHNTP